MKIIYSGGYNKVLPESVQHAFFHTYHPTIKKAANNGKKIALVTLAKPDGYFDELILPLYSGLVDIIDNTKTGSVSWGIYDGIFILGGTMKLLFEGLQKSHFDLSQLKKDVVILGDSAGAYMLSSYYYDSP
jgi:hypothetical protein